MKKDYWNNGFDVECRKKTAITAFTALTD